MATTSVQVVQMPPHIIVPPPQPIQHLKTIKGLAITQLIIGILTTLLGIVSIASLDFLEFATHIGTGIWAGSWIALTGLLGVCHAHNNNLNGVYMAFSIISSVGSALAGFFSIASIVYYSSLNCKLETGINTGYYNSEYTIQHNHRCEFKNLGLDLYVPSLILMIVEFFVSIFAAVYCCKSNGCCCVGTPGVVLHQQPYMPLVEECGGGSTRVAAPAGSTVITSTSGYPTNNVQYPPRYGGPTAPQYGGQTTLQYGGYVAPQYGGQVAPQYGGQAAPQYGGQAVPQYGGQAVTQHGNQMQPQYHTQTEAGYGDQASGTAEPPPVYSEKALVDI